MGGRSYHRRIGEEDPGAGEERCLSVVSAVEAPTCRSRPRPRGTLPAALALSGCSRRWLLGAGTPRSWPKQGPFLREQWGQSAARSTHRRRKATRRANGGAESEYTRVTYHSRCGKRSVWVTGAHLDKIVEFLYMVHCIFSAVTAGHTINIKSTALSCNAPSLLCERQAHAEILLCPSK